MTRARTDFADAPAQEVVKGDFALVAEIDAGRYARDIHCATA